ncbi:kinase-like protein [Annulohypoxylon nitens]|nr:kinase-like protein [Annulohypoxylon nitens]
MLSPEEIESFGPLLDIPEASLEALTIKIFERVFHKACKGARFIGRAKGSYNLVHFVHANDDLIFVIRVSGAAWGSGKTDTAARALESTVATMRFVAKNSSIPVPEVYDFDTTDDNEIQAPYMCISFISGTPVSYAWNNKSIHMPLIQFRQNILRSLAQVMAQFSSFSFDKIGSITSDEANSQALAPCYDWKHTEDGALQVVSSGPFDSVSDYLKYHYKECDHGDINATRADHMLRGLIIPAWIAGLANDPSEGFVLRPPDFDAQNVMVDDEGNITGFLDWDHAHTLPRSLGYARIPAWLMRDWDPPRRHLLGTSMTELPNIALDAYRNLYVYDIGTSLNWQGDWEFALKSHLSEAVWAAAHHGCYRREICQKLIKAAMKTMNGNQVDCMNLLFRFENDFLGEEEWNMLNDGFKHLFLT